MSNRREYLSGSTCFEPWTIFALPPVKGCQRGMRSALIDEHEPSGLDLFSDHPRQAALSHSAVHRGDGASSARGPSARLHRGAPANQRFAAATTTSIRSLVWALYNRLSEGGCHVASKELVYRRSLTEQPPPRRRFLEDTSRGRVLRDSDSSFVGALPGEARAFT